MGAGPAHTEVRRQAAAHLGRKAQTPSSGSPDTRFASRLLFMASAVASWGTLWWPWCARSAGQGAGAGGAAAALRVDGRFPDTRLPPPNFAEAKTTKLPNNARVGAAATRFCRGAVRPAVGWRRAARGLRRFIRCSPQGDREVFKTLCSDRTGSDGARQNEGLGAMNRAPTRHPRLNAPRHLPSAAPAAPARQTRGSTTRGPRGWPRTR